MKIEANDLLELGIIDRIVNEEESVTQSYGKSWYDF